MNIRIKKIFLGFGNSEYVLWPVGAAYGEWVGRFDTRAQAEAALKEIG